MFVNEDTSWFQTCFQDTMSYLMIQNKFKSALEENNGMFSDYNTYFSVESESKIYKNVVKNRKLIYSFFNFIIVSFLIIYRIERGREQNIKLKTWFVYLFIFLIDWLCFVFTFCLFLFLFGFYNFFCPVYVCLVSFIKLIFLNYSMTHLKLILQ